MSTKADQLEWRRSKVVEMRARDLGLGEIARELQVSRASLSSDIAYLRNEAKDLGLEELDDDPIMRMVTALYNDRVPQS